MSPSASPRIAYFFDADVGAFHYAPGHPMKPLRMAMTHALIVGYRLDRKMDLLVLLCFFSIVTAQTPRRASAKDMTRCHTDEYIDFLSRVSPETMDRFVPHQARFNVGDDCPVFDGLFEFCSISAGGSISAADRINSGDADIAIKHKIYSSILADDTAGLAGYTMQRNAKHQAYPVLLHPTLTSQFCYVNDIVLSILELLKYHKRVLYIDIDIHHGDGVEEFFYTTDRVMTCSFHKFGQFFPGTGALGDVGIGPGKNYSVNIPLNDGIDDLTYESVFKPIISRIIQFYRPEAIVLQCGADSLAGDKLGCFNLSVHGHAEAVKFVKSFNIPLIALGGGGYTIKNVARAWTYETAILLGEELAEDIPFNEYIGYFGPDYKICIPPNSMDNKNSRAYLDHLIEQTVERLRNIPSAPSVQSSAAEVLYAEY
ncbi:Histone deacetylase clr6 [Neolecta irregularis DAH-3]|uniref:Histone deacetylase n=1 Tax=Neolecta irregularis (strain DAH-3) TaxID=1198029 RepID=A0A1U7LIF3_NEOID|nr:Histone deacetylase clr6 [Neolecta irregularis DAH-3]|eukprot:OLL22408.1 Histone deacetylase clr6 [Neolecta irregularis DAH-3]